MKSPASGCSSARQAGGNRIRYFCPLVDRTVVASQRFRSNADLSLGSLEGLDDRRITVALRRPRATAWSISETCSCASVGLAHSSLELFHDRKVVGCHDAAASFLQTDRSGHVTLHHTESTVAFATYREESLCAVSGICRAIVGQLLRGSFASGMPGSPHELQGRDAKPEFYGRARRALAIRLSSVGLFAPCIAPCTWGTRNSSCYSPSIAGLGNAGSLPDAVVANWPTRIPASASIARICERRQCSAHSPAPRIPGRADGTAPSVA
jgi:hypothetical protein